MTKSKLLSAALIAAAMIATPAMARQSHVSSRHAADRSYAYATPNAPYYNSYNYYGGRVCYPAPRVGAFATQPWGNDVPCEPTFGYY